MHGAYSSGNAKRHYCLMDSSYDGGGWTLLYSMNHGNNFASGSNYSFALNVGSNPTNTNDFIASNFGYDRRNTFTPQAGDQFLIRRSDNNDWRRFVVTTWSPTANSVSNGWTTTNDTTGTNRGHPYYALGQMYDTSGNAVSGMVHFNGCAIGGNCNSGGGDGDGFGDHVNWSSGYSPYSSVGVVPLMVKVMEDHHCTGDKIINYLKVVLFMFKCSIVRQVHSNGTRKRRCN